MTNKPNTTTLSRDAAQSAGSVPVTRVALTPSGTIRPEEAPAPSEDQVRQNPRTDVSTPAADIPQAEEPANAALARFAMSSAAFLRELHLRGVLLPLLRDVTVERELVYKADQAGLTVTDDEVQAAVDEYRRRNRLVSTEDTHVWLNGRGLTQADFEAAIGRQVLLDKLRDQLTQGMVASHFDKDPSRYEHARLSRVVADREDIAQKLLALLRENRRSLYTEPRKGAEDHSGVVLTGELVFRHQLSSELAKAIFAAKSGDIIGPFATSRGYELVLVEHHEKAKLDGETAEKIRSELFRASQADWSGSVQIEPDLLGLL